MISTHILDTSLGMPAENVRVVLEKQNNQNNYVQLGDSKTNADGRIVFDIPKDAGIYKLTFEIEEYFKRQGLDPFFMNTPIIFKITNTNRKYHVPLLLNPYGLSTYRGS
jgi:5-hydroxyisourate hydrolase